MQQANASDACDVCAGRCTLEEARETWCTVTCSQHFIDVVFPEEEELRLPPKKPSPGEMQFRYS